MNPLFTNDAIVLGLLMAVLAFVFYTSGKKTGFWARFYKVVPALLMCYFLPALLSWPLGWISGDTSNLYFVASRYLLPASLILLTLSTDFKAILKLGSKALIMFAAATLGIIIGGPIAHPPTLFLGFSSTMVPFAFAVGALIKKDFEGWLAPVLPWALFSGGILGIGILMGGAWAYEALTFGGYWAWDPVENMSLVPWLILVAFWLKSG